MTSAEKTEYDKKLGFNKWLDRKYPALQLDDYTFYPSEVLFMLDREAYQQAYGEYETQRLTTLRSNADVCLDWRGSQRQRFERLVDAAKRSAVVPFVGAGLTIPCGMKGWQSFLYHLADESLTKRETLDAHLQSGEYEEAAELLHTLLGEPWFSDLIETEFGRNVKPTGAVCLLPRLTRTCLITTNFDQVIERVFREHNRPLDLAIGSNADAFYKALSQNRNYLLKVHGDVDRAQDRILTFTHYKAAYGDGEIDFARSLPKALKRAFGSKVLLFLGCSLGPDRTMSLFRKLFEAECPPDRHFAIMEAPATDADRVKREKILFEHGIIPLWYPPGEHDCVEALVQLLVDRMEER